MLRAVLFDIDGTLVDSNDLHAEAWSEAFGSVGIDVPAHRVRPHIGKGSDQLLPAFCSPDEQKRFGKQLSEKRKQIFKERREGRVSVFPGVRQLFERLHADGIRIALATSATAEELAFHRKLLGLDSLISEVTSADDVEHSKPAPDVFQAALEKCAISPDEALVIGDTPYDAEAASRAHIATVGLLCGGFALEDLRAAGCIACFEGPAHLLANYEKSPLRRQN